MTSALILPFTQPHITLSIEEYLLNTLPAHESFFLLYQHEPSVIIGKNQIVWLEVDTHYAQQHNIPIFRRISGGGTVFHDFGNINYSFITPKSLFSQTNNLSSIAIALNALLTTGHITPNKRGDLYLNNTYKISGNALRHGRTHTLHHGTLLVNTQLNSLSLLLQGFRKQPDIHIISHAIASHPAPVCNISSLLHKKLQNPHTLMQTILTSINNIKPITNDTIINTLYTNSVPYQDKYHTNDWNIHRSPEFQITYKDLHIKIEKGHITHCMYKNAPLSIKKPFYGFPHILDILSHIP